MFGLGIQELIIIGIVVVVFFYGSDKLIDFARSAGKLTSEFKKSKTQAEKELKEIKKDLSMK